MISISYLVGVHNENSHYLTPLFDRLLKYKQEGDEIIVVDDFSTNESTLKSLSEYEDKFDIYKIKFENDFSKHKNEMNSLCTRNYIFNIDADELPNEILLSTLKEILINNPEVDLFYVPRINFVKDLTDEYITKWGWDKNNLNYINYPDYQGRIYKNSEKIKWVNKVHEKISGVSNYSLLPAFDENEKPYPDYCLLHIKDFERQLEQNNKYMEISK